MLAQSLVILLSLVVVFPFNAMEDKQEAEKPLFLVEWGKAETQGKRETMQDASEFYCDEKTGNCIGIVADGHGGLTTDRWKFPSGKPFDSLQENEQLLKDFPIINSPQELDGGKAAAALTVRHLRENFPLNTPSEQMSDALYNTMVAIEKNINSYPSLSNAGTTLLAGIIKPTEGKGFIGNIGDSRAILIEDKNVLWKTDDHRPANEFERLDMQREIFEEWFRIRVSRTIGDKKCKEKGVGDYQNKFIADPAITALCLRPNQTLVFACDGVWDELRNEQVASIVDNHQQKSAPELAEIIKNEAVKGRTGDNVSVLVAKLIAPHAASNPEQKVDQNQLIISNRDYASPHMSSSSSSH